jgi:hypothetical protein
MTQYQAQETHITLIPILPSYGNPFSETGFWQLNHGSVTILLNVEEVPLPKSRIMNCGSITITFSVQKMLLPKLKFIYIKLHFLSLSLIP